MGEAQGGRTRQLGAPSLTNLANVRPSCVGWKHRGHTGPTSSLLKPGRRQHPAAAVLRRREQVPKFLGRGVVEMDADLVAAALGRAFGGMNAIFDRFDFPEDELETMSNGLIEDLQQVGMAGAVGIRRALRPMTPTIISA